MAKWIITNIESKSVCEIKSWIKQGQIIQLVEFYRFGEWSCESEIKPEIDLINEDGFEVTDSRYQWNMEFMSDGMGYEWEFPDEMDEAEQEAIEEAWSEQFYEGLEALGWEEQADSHWIYGAISLEEEKSSA